MRKSGANRTILLEILKEVSRAEKKWHQMVHKPTGREAFLRQYMTYPGEWSICAGKEYIFSYCYVEKYI